MKTLGVALLALFSAAPALAQETGGRVSLGYAYVRDSGHNVPFGAYLAANTRDPIGLGAELAYHRYSLDYGGFTFDLNTATALAGLHYAADVPDFQPFFHLLVGARLAWTEDDNDAAFGGEAGGGLDARVGDDVFFRVGLDFQFFLNDNDTSDLFRATAGLAFNL